MAIVRRGVMLSLRLASCWSVEVVNGGEGERCLSARLTLLTVKAALFVSAMISSISAREDGSNFFPFLP